VNIFWGTRSLKGEIRVAQLPVWSGHDGPGSLNIEVGAEIIPHQLHKIWGEAESLLRKNGVPASWPNFGRAPEECSKNGNGNTISKCSRIRNAISSNIIQEETK